MRLIDADALKDSIQVHYSVVEQDCGISAKFADGAISGLDGAMFEVDDAPVVEAIPINWLRGLLCVSGDSVDKVVFDWIKHKWDAEKDDL